MTKPMLFELGNIVATPGALRVFEEINYSPRPGLLLMRHATGDWGVLDAEDIAANNRAVAEGTRILSAYDLPGGRRMYIITEADRSATTYLLPEEY